MHKAIRKSYEFKKREVDIYYANVRKTEAVEDAVECIYCVGEADSLARILEVEYGEDLEKERKYLRQMKNCLKDMLNIVAVIK